MLLAARVIVLSSGALKRCLRPWWAALHRSGLLLLLLLTTVLIVLAKMIVWRVGAVVVDRCAAIAASGQFSGRRCWWVAAFSLAWRGDAVSAFYSATISMTLLSSIAAPGAAVLLVCSEGLCVRCRSH